MIVASEAATLSSQVIHPARVAKNCNLAALSLASTVLSLAVQNLALTALSLASTDSLHLFVEQLATNLAWTVLILASTDLSLIKSTVLVLEATTGRLLALSVVTLALSMVTLNEDAAMRLHP